MEQLDFRPVLLAWAEMQADELGAKKCNRKGVGGMLRRLRRHADLPDIYGASVPRSIQILEIHCKFCGKCRGPGE